MSASSRAPIRPRVASLSGQCRETISDDGQQLLQLEPVRLAALAPRRLAMTTRMPKASRDSRRAAAQLAPADHAEGAAAAVRGSDSASTVERFVSGP